MSDSSTDEVLDDTDETESVDFEEVGTKQVQCTWSLIGSEASLTLTQRGSGRCRRCQEYGIICITTVNECRKVICDNCRAGHRPAWSCNVDVTPIAERYPRVRLDRGASSRTSSTRVSATTGRVTVRQQSRIAKTKDKRKSYQEGGDPKSVIKTRSDHFHAHCLIGSSTSTSVSGQNDYNRLVARTLLRQSIKGIEDDATNRSAVVRAFVPGLRSAYDLLYPDHPL